MNNVIVKCRNVHKSYHNGAEPTRALRGVDLDVNQNELLMILGPSGCGKTTLLSVIAGILDQDEGSCTVFEKELIALPTREKTRFRGENIGFIFQAFNLIPMLTALENVMVPLLLLDTPREEARDHAAKLLITLGLEDKLLVQPRNLSGGQLQRVAIARGIIHKPGLIVCDEPTSNLDHKTGLQVVEHLKTIAKEENCAVILVTHDVRIFEFADRMCEMEDGRIKNEKRNGS